MRPTHAVILRAPTGKLAKFCLNGVMIKFISQPRYIVAVYFCIKINVSLRTMTIFNAKMTPLKFIISL